MLAVGTVSAQTNPATNAGDATLIKNAGDGVSVRVIDNKGTIKYLQTNNGITSITSTTAANTTTTTWQLGGALTDDTFIDVNGNIFGLNGITTATNSAATSITSGGDGVSGAAETGFALLVREEATGETKKLLLTDLILSGQEYFDSTTVTPVVATASGATLSLPLAGSPQILVGTNRVTVYRNGAKLIINRDFTVVDGATPADPSSVLLAPTAVAPYDWFITAEDQIEVHWNK